MKKEKTLKEDIDNMQKGMLKNIPAEAIKEFQEAAKRLAAKNLEKNSLKKGDKIPEFSLLNIHGKNVSSKELLKKGPLVISFTRGSWCPYCNLEIVALQKAYPEIKKSGANLISISPNVPEKYSEMETKHSLTFDLLSDIGNKIAKKFGLVFILDTQLKPFYKQMGIDIPGYNGDNSFELPFPATYVVDTNGTVIYSYVNSDYTSRAEPSEILKVLKSI